MLVEADIRPTAISEERPVKRKRPGYRRDQIAQHVKPSPENSNHEQLGGNVEKQMDEDEDADDVQFEDVVLPAPTIQTVYRSDDEEEEEEDDEGDEGGNEAFEDVDFSAQASIRDVAQDVPKDLDLDLSSRMKPTPTKTIDRRKPINRAEKDRRVEIHRLHLLCLLAHVARRNRWCNDPQVQDSLRPLLTQKMVTQLNPGSHLTQFGQANSLKEGLNLVNNMFVAKFRITERGIRRALWAETDEHLQDVQSAIVSIIRGGS
jgi:xeroderma pigmentosum group C-complementing protein